MRVAIGLRGHATSNGPNSVPPVSKSAIFLVEFVAHSSLLKYVNLAHHLAIASYELIQFVTKRLRTKVGPIPRTQVWSFTHVPWPHSSPPLNEMFARENRRFRSELFVE